VHDGAVGDTRNELFPRHAMGGGRGWQGKTKWMKQYKVNLRANRPELLSSSFPPHLHSIRSRIERCPPGILGGAGTPCNTAATSTLESLDGLYLAPLSSAS
jgi:hypothetical protein